MSNSSLLHTFPHIIFLRPTFFIEIKTKFISVEVGFQLRLIKLIISLKWYTRANASKRYMRNTSNGVRSKILESVVHVDN